jgi:hypothetical protein
MKIGKINKVELSGLIVLFVGVILLAITFFSAYSFLAEDLSTLAGHDILEAFGAVMAPLIGAIIRILFLGIMGWVGSLLTIRGVQLLKKERTEVAQTQTQQQPVKTENKQTTKQESKPETTQVKTEAEKPAKVKETEKIETPENHKQVEKPEEVAALSSPASTSSP